MNEREIKDANRRALPKFIVIFIACCAIGFFAGFFTSFLEVDHFSDAMRTAGEFFIYPVAPWLLIAAVILNPLQFLYFISKVKNLMSAWDGEDEEVSDHIDTLLSKELGISSIFYIFAIFLLAAGNSGLWQREDINTVSLISLAAFFVLIIETVIIQQKCVDATKKMNPEKAGSVYDTNFHRKWLDSSDEAEKIMIGKCAYKAFRVSNNVCAALAIILAVLAIFFNIGILPSLSVCLIWAVNQIVYIRESILISRRGSSIL